MRTLEHCVRELEQCVHITSPSVITTQADTLLHNNIAVYHGPNTILHFKECSLDTIQARRKHIFFGQAKFDHAYSVIQREHSINVCMRTSTFAHAHAQYSVTLVHNLSRPLFLTNIGPAKTGPTGPVAPALP